MQVLNLERSVIVLTCKEAEPLSVPLCYLTAVDCGDVVLILVLFHVPAVPVLILNELVVRTSLELSELVGTPRSGGLKRRVVLRGVKGCASCGSDLACLVEILLYERKRGHVVCCPKAKRTVICKEGIGLVKADNNCVLLRNSIEAYAIPRYFITVLTGEVVVEGRIVLYCTLPEGLLIGSQ